MRELWYTVWMHNRVVSRKSAESEFSFNSGLKSGTAKVPRA
jgi:hypothetical protein